ncbi:hypothetical protein B5F07_07865 [Lachnoclostridium sp. An169]|mgnify:CR=1 FL=1|uniref:MATE family efflux transporter n=1 Tax=Lachnoclostridium sp. An169 TaxID=1965569 RepID=UPI000B3AC867|nr:MATE family efflux transporter [Lachnoclostridium sp. An169]OUP84369.1 hypothetical protein B5F07_07865 [Lachnoclostridium sp. An169]
MKAEKTEELFAKGNVWMAIAKMGIPAVATMLVVLLYNMADQFFVAQTGDSLQIAAISLSSPLYSLAMAAGTLVGGGGMAAVSNALGGKNTKLVKALSSAALILVLAAGVVFTGAVLIFPDQILGMLGVDESTWQYTKDYITILALGMVFILFSNAFANIIRAEGAAKESMIGNGIGTLANIILDPIFILAFGMGVKGAAIATVIGNMLASVYYVVYIYRSRSELSLNPKYAFEVPVAFWRVAVLGVPNAVSTLLNSLTGTISNHILMGYGASAVVAMSVGGKASMIVSMVVMGICMGVQPIIAYNYGAGNVARTKEVLTKITVVSVVAGALLTVVCWWQRPAIAGLFLSDPALLDQSVQIMSISLITTAFLGFYYVGLNFQQAAGNAGRAVVLSVLRQGILYVPAIYLMNWSFGLEGVYWVSVICDTVSIILAVGLLLYQMRPGTLPESSRCTS